jgi:hypothetical protein
MDGSSMFFENLQSLMDVRYLADYILSILPAAHSSSRCSEKHTLWSILWFYKVVYDNSDIEFSGKIYEKTLQM